MNNIFLTFYMRFENLLFWPTCLNGATQIMMCVVYSKFFKTKGFLKHLGGSEN